ncbi:MAG: hypothetical protein LUE29_09320 [Lachnospiraceae bacterium]|nr:hypothetical protein [Lachnospiraceae bacterium]
MKYRKIIFVDKSNTSRSVLAEGLFRKYWDSSNYLAIRSRGMVVLFPEPANQKIVEIGRQKHVYLEQHEAKQLTEEDFSDSALILVMMEQYKKKIYEEYPSAVNVYTIKEFVGENGDVDDPYGRDLLGYAEFATELERLVIRVVEKLEQELV